MPAANAKRRDSVTLVVLLAIQLVLMSGAVRRQDGSSMLESAVMRLTSPIVRAAGAVGGGLRGIGTRVRETWIARRENAHLRRDVFELQQQIVELERDAAEAERLRGLLDMREEVAPEAVVARVLARTTTGQSRILVIDRGEDAGVVRDSPVVAWGGAVGRVLFADRARSKVLLMNDPNSAIAGMVQRSRVQGIVIGQGDERLVMDYVSGDADVEIGDRVVTSGMDGIFPMGYSLGRVFYARDLERVSKAILLRSEVDFDRIEEVLVLSRPDAGRYVTPPVREPDR